MTVDLLRNIPAELKERKQWVLWLKELRDGKLTKVLYNARSGKKALSNKPATWCTYDEAIAGLSRFPHFHGIGYVFASNDPYVGIDLDDCIDADGQIAAWAREYLDLVDTYWERSQSKKGVHGIAKGALPPKGRKRGQVEMYSERRFFATTGDHVEGTPASIEDRAEQILTMHARVFVPKVGSVPPNGARPAAPATATEATIVEKVCRDPKYDALWRGDWKQYYPSQSEADLVLAGRIAFFTGPDAGLVDRIFRQSQLLRPKWDDPGHGRADSTYGADTAAMAIAGKTQFYDWTSRNGTGASSDDEAPPHPADTETQEEEPAAEPIALDSVTAIFRKWLYLPDDGHIKVALGTYAANKMAGDPVWLMIVGAPGSGKTEALVSLGRLPNICVNSSLSGEAALLSGTPNRDKTATASGGLLKEIGAFGVLVLKDFTSMLQMKHEVRAPLLAALREVYDGSWTRRIGVDGGKTLTWAGKLGLIAGCTPIIDSHHAVIGAMGERFVLYRLPVASAEEQANKALDHDGKENDMRRELAAAVRALFAGLDLSQPPVALSPKERTRLVDLATLAVRCRSAVERDGRTREILLVPDPEAPGRLAGVLSRLLRGMTAIGVDRAEAWRLLAKVSLDSMPALRWSAFRYAAEQPAGAPIPTTDFATATRHPTVTVRRALEDLHAHDLLVRKKASGGNADLWELSEWARTKYSQLEELFRKNPMDTEEVSSEVSPSPSSSSPFKLPETARGGFSDTRACTGTTTPVLDLSEEREGQAQNADRERFEL